LQQLQLETPRLDVRLPDGYLLEVTARLETLLSRLRRAQDPGWAAPTANIASANTASSTSAPPRSIGLNRLVSILED
jgi:hypothetical protein